MAGEDLIEAIKANADLLKINNCPGVPAQLGKAMHGSWQDDAGDGTGWDARIALEVGKAQLWHFQTTSSKGSVHHFCALWWHDGGGKLVFTLLMAYEGEYTLGKYIAGENGGALTNGYKDKIDKAKMDPFLAALTAHSSTWKTCFCTKIKEKTKDIKLWKYPSIAIDDAVKNVKAFSGV